MFAQFNKRVLISMCVLLLTVWACSYSPTPPPTYPPPGPDLALTVTSFAQTLSALTAYVPASATLPAYSLPTATGLPPTASPIPLTPTFTVVPSPTVPMVSVTTGTNCRTGPGVVYDVIGGAPVGVRFLLVGKNSYTNYWIIQLPDGRQCWLWGRYAIVEGNVAALPEYPIPPTPLPPLGSVSGTIRDVGGSPISGATVVAELANRTFTSRPDGTYSFDNLPLGMEYLTVDSFNFAPAHRSVVVVQGNVSGVDIPLRGLSIPSGSGVMVYGRVLINSVPAAGVAVQFWGRGQSTTTDINGSYSFGFIPGGGYDDVLILAQSGNLRGGVELVSPTMDPIIMPDLNLLRR